MNDKIINKVGTTIAFSFILCFIVFISLYAYAEIDSRNSLQSLDKWERQGIIENLSCTDCYGRQYNSAQRFIQSSWVYLPDSDTMFTKDIPSGKAYKIYHKSYFGGFNYYLIVCVD